MFAVRSIRMLAGAAVLATALTACSDNPAGLDPSELDATEVAAQEAQLESALNVPVLYSLLGESSSSVSLSVAPAPLNASASLDPLGAVRSNGTLFRQAVKAALTGPMFAVANPGEDASWYIIPEVWGQTYVRDAATGEYMWDDTRTDAPARGIRIVLYQRTGLETFNNTVVGALDLIDSSTTTSQVGRINLYDAQNHLVATFRETNTETGVETRTVNATFTGSFGVSPKTFVVADTMTGTVTETATTYSSNLRWRSISKATFMNAERSLLIEGMDLGADEDTGSLELRILMGEHTTRMVASSTGANAGTVQIYVDDALVAKSVETATGAELRAPNGGVLSPKVQSYLTAVFMAAARLPDATVLRVVIAFVMPYFV
jgi:hypothetical protein